jgi:hypothetical protein
MQPQQRKANEHSTNNRVVELLPKVGRMDRIERVIQHFIVWIANNKQVIYLGCQSQRSCQLQIEVLERSVVSCQRSFPMLPQKR